MTITKDQVKAELKRLAEENPRKVADCYYSAEVANMEPKPSVHEETHPGETAMCIAGQLVKNLTPELYPLLWENKAIDHQGTNQPLLLDAGYEPGALRVLSHAQGSQDSGEDWATAVVDALDWDENWNSEGSE